MLSTGNKMERAKSSIFGIKGRRYKLWWYRNNDETEEEELCEKIMEVQRKSD